MKALANLYARFSALASYLQSPFLLAVRLYWGWQFAQSGWGRLHHISQATSFFASLNLPFPEATVIAISTLEFVGGILLIVRPRIPAHRLIAGGRYVRGVFDCRSRGSLLDLLRPWKVLWS